MKFGTIVQPQGPAGVAEGPGGRLVLLADLGVGIAGVRALIEGGDAALEAVRAALARPGLRLIDPAGVRWAPPIPDPSKILCVALNNSAADYQLRYRPDFPVYFPKLPSALNGHGEPLELAPHFGLVHPEPELCVVIGRRARRVPIEAAMEHVFGYAIFDDVTGVGMRKEDNFVAEYPLPQADGSFKPVTEHVLYQGRYKNADGFAPMGPLIAHKSVVPDPMDLGVRCWLDGELIMDDRTSGYHFTIAEVIHWISAHATLHPGDVVALGTALHPDVQRRPISWANINKSGDVVRIEIESLGELLTPVRRVEREDPRAHFAASKRFKARG